MSFGFGMIRMLLGIFSYNELSLLLVLLLLLLLVKL